jgi:hypothetical protein
MAAMRRGVRIVMGVIALMVLTTTVAWAAPLWQDDEQVTTDALWIVLAPLIAIAGSIERVLEMLWDRWEKAGLWPNPEGADKSDPSYIMKKQARSHWVGTGLAVVAIGLTNVRLFRLLGFEVLFSSPDLVLFNAGVGGILDDFTVGTLIDWLLTAVLIGWGGTELTHNVIEGLVKGRGLWKEMREVSAGERSIADVRFFTRYVAPELEERGISVASLRQALETLDSFGVSVDEFIGSMTVGKVDEFVSELAAKPETAEAAQAVRTFLDGVPTAKQVEFPDISSVINLMTSEQRQRFLGA